MKLNTVPVKWLFWGVSIGTTLIMCVITLVLFVLTHQTATLVTGGLLIFCSFIGLLLLTLIWGKRLSLFTSDLCKTLDNMIDGKEEPEIIDDRETLLARINHRLSRLYQIMQENRRRVDEERQKLQTLVSDISHQVKTPVSNLKMVTDTLLAFFI